MPIILVCSRSLPDAIGDYISMKSNDDVRMAFDVPGKPGQNDGAGRVGVVTLFVSARGMIGV